MLPKFQFLTFIFFHDTQKRHSVIKLAEQDFNRSKKNNAKECKCIMGAPIDWWPEQWVPAITYSLFKHEIL